MTKHQEILAWLSTKHHNFKKGAELYDKYGTNIFLKKRFNMGENPYNRALLLEELKQMSIALEDVAKPIVKKKRKPKPKTIVKNVAPQKKVNKPTPETKQEIQLEHYKTASQYTGLSTTEFSLLPKELKDIAVENVKLNNIAEKTFRMLRKRNAGKVIEHLSKEEIEENALQCEIVVESMRINQMGWDEIRHWQRKKRFKRQHPYFKKIAATAELKNLSRSDLMLRKKNRQSNLVNYKKKLENSTDEKQKMKTKAKIDQWLIEIEAINKLLEKKK